jgi:type I restriction enzyme S subunit
MSNQASLGDIADSDNSTRAESKEDSTHDSYLQLGPDTLDIPESWGKTEFADTFSHQRGVNYSGDNYVEEGEGMIFLTLNAIAPGGGLKKDSLKYYKDEISEKRKVKPGDILMANTDLNQEGEIVGYPVKVPDFESDQEICFSHHLLKIEQKKEKFNEQFLEYLFSSDYIHSRMIAFSCGSTVLNLNTSLLEKLELPVPEKDEQRRIASVLYNVDQAIQKTEEIIEQTQRVKKGLMQDLFTEGYYSHEEFEEVRIGPIKKNIPKAWDFVPMEKAVINRDSERDPVKSKKREEMQGDIPYYGASGIIDHVNDYLFDEELILLAEDGANLVTRTKPISFIIDGKTWVNNHAHVLEPQEDFNIDYLMHFFRTLKYEPFITATAQPKLNQKMLNMIEVPKPPKDEQEKIAEVLRGLENKFSQLKEEKEQLQRLKKGLMQDLLTGSVRTGEDVRVLDEVVEVEG